MYIGAILPQITMLTLSATETEYILADGEHKIEVPLQWTNGQKIITVTKTFTFERGKFLVKQSQQVNNQSSDSWVASEYLQITHAEHVRKGSLLVVMWLTRVLLIIMKNI